MSTTTARAAALTALAVTVGLLGGCSTFTSTSTASSSALPGPGEEGAGATAGGRNEKALPVMEVSSAGRFDPLTSMLPPALDLVLYPDGLLITTAQGDPVSPIVAYDATQLSAGQVDDLLGAARDAGLVRQVEDQLESDDTWGTLTLTLRVDGETYVHRASALVTVDGAPVDDAESPVLAFLEKEVGALVPEDGTPYEPSAYFVAATWGLFDAGESDEPMAPLPEWPLDEALSTMSSCHVVDGADADAVEAAARATEGSSGIWVDDNMTYFVSLRPLLPHESTCPE